MMVSGLNVPSRRLKSAGRRIINRTTQTATHAFDALITTGRRGSVFLLFSNDSRFDHPIPALIRVRNIRVSES